MKVTIQLPEERLAQPRPDLARPRTGRRLEPSEVRELQLPPVSDRERELAWRHSHQDELQRRFAGQWVVLEDEEIVAHSEDAAQAIEQARAKGVAVPFVFFVDEPRPGVVHISL